MIHYKLDDFNIKSIQTAMDEFETQQRPDINLFVYGAQDRPERNKMAVYVTNYSCFDKMEPLLKAKGVALINDGVGSYQGTDKVSVGLSKTLRENVQLCAKVVWVIHATA